MKKTILSSIMIAIISVSGFAQDHTGVTLRGYSEENLTKLIDSIHQQSKKEIAGLQHSYDCYVIFDVHSNGSISNIEFLQLPKAPLDPKAKEHVASVFQATDGKWMLNEIESGQATKKVIFLFHWLNPASLLKHASTISLKLSNIL